MRTAIALVASLSLACASTGARKDTRDLSRMLAERDGQLRASLDHQNDLQIALAQETDDAQRNEAEIHDLRNRLARHVTEEQELQAERAAGMRARTELGELQQKINSLDRSSKEGLSEKLRACEASIPDKELLFYNQALVDVFKSLEVVEQPRIREGTFADDYYLHIEVRIGGQRLWEQTVQTAHQEGPLSKAIATAADVIGISSTLRAKH